jgi:putative addiction module component (TIGR02574 family)
MNARQFRLVEESMDLSTTLSAINALSVDERIRLVEAVWDGIAAEQPTPQLTQPQKQELRRRFDGHQASPDDVVAWEDVKAQALVRGNFPCNSSTSARPS